MSAIAPLTSDPTCLAEGCIQSNDPRKSSCCRCGSKIASTDSARPATRPRDLERERLITREASSPYVDPTAFIYYAEKRSQTLSDEYVDDPMFVRTDRDRLEDVREELLDARNHLVWWLEDHTDDYRVADALDALRGIVAIYQTLST